MSNSTIDMGFLIALVLLSVLLPLWLAGTPLLVIYVIRLAGYDMPYVWYTWCIAFVCIWGAVLPSVALLNRYSDSHEDS